ncbi:MAG: choice-of-anchor D domain-containing protein [Calditrichia bacterium]
MLTFILNKNLFVTPRALFAMLLLSTAMIFAQPQPDIDVQPAALNFGNVGVSDDSLLTISIGNRGTAELQVTSIDVIGADASEFSLPNVPVFPIVIQPGGAEVSVDVRFSPTTGGVKSGFLIMVNNDPDENPLDVALSGTGVFPDIEPSAVALNFGELPAGSDSLRALGISNLGQGNLLISSLQLVGANASEFAFQAPPLPIKVTPGGSAAQVIISFNPTFKGSKVAFLSIVSNDPDENPLFIQLDGTATEADIRLSVEEFDYGNVPVGDDSTQQLRIFNDGDAVLMVTDLQIAGGNENQFLLVNPPVLPLLIQPGGSSGFIQTRFVPTSGGLKTSTLTIVSNDPDEGQQQIILRGTGIEPDIKSDVNPLNYGPVVVGDSLTIFFQISNVGLAPLIITDTSLVSSDGQFEVVTFPSLPVTVPPNGGRAPLSVKFKPLALGASSATLQVISNDPDENPFEVELLGTGVQPRIVTVPDTLNFGNVLIKTDSITQILIRNDGGAPLTVSDTSITGINSNLFSFEEVPAIPFTILSGGNPVALALRYSPAELGESQAIFNLISNDPLEPIKSVVLNGSGAAPDLAVNSDSLLFGRVVLDSIETLPMVIRNEGTYRLLVSNVRLTGSDSLLFETQIRDFPQSISPGDSLQFSVNFSPIEERVSAVNLIIESDDPEFEELVVPVIGRGALPRISVGIDSLDYHAVPVSGDSTFLLPIVNVGAAPLTIQSIDLAGINSPEFRLKNVPDLPFVIPPDSAAFILEVAFRPLLTTGRRQALLAIGSNDRANPFTSVFLSGRGVIAPVIQSIRVNPELGQDSQILVTASADTTLRQVRVRYGNANSDGFTAGAINLSDLGGGVYSGVLPGAAITSNGIKLEAAVSDEYPVTVRDTIFSSVSIPAGEITLGSASSSLTALNRWQMFSLPYDAITDANKSIASILADLGEEGDFTWRIYRVDPTGSNSSYLGSDALNSRPDSYGRFEPGNAFWLYLRDDADGQIPTTTLTFPAMQTVSPDSFVYALQPGWNQVGNPYSFPVPWDSVRSSGKESLQIYRWDGQAWQDSLAKSGWTPLLGANFSVEPWGGYAVMNNSPDAVNIVFDPRTGTSGKISPAPSSKLGDWQLVLRAENNHSFDVNVLGMHAEALDEKDRFDYPNPSSPDLQGVSIVFAREEWGSDKTYFATDFRKTSQNGDTWRFGIRSSETVVSLTMQQISALPGGFEVVLFDSKYNERYDLRSNSEITLRAIRSEEESRFALLVAPAADIESALSGIERLVPSQPHLAQNYPNPFNPSTRIPYQVAKSGRVVIRIYSILGQAVRTLVNGEQNAGFYEVEWDGRTNAGKVVASGLYFYMLETSGTQDVKRLIKLK